MNVVEVSWRATCWQLVLYLELQGRGMGVGFVFLSLGNEFKGTQGGAVWVTPTTLNSKP